ncbi:MAG: FHA domain-containing protein [bacterium]|nr:FHA domain-containing protein [bacterium]
MEDSKNPLEQPNTTPTTDFGQENPLTTHDVRDEAEEALKRYLASNPTSEMFIEIASPLVGSEVHIRLEIQGWADPLTVTFTKEAIIGRKDPILAFTPEIDLTSYGGYQMGISRKHATIRHNGDKLELVDLGSRNGTFLNGKKLESEQSVPLTHNDEIRLGKIIMTLYVQQEELS